MDRKSKACRNNDKINIGWREWISFPNYDNFRLKAKIDSGARTSALHATHLHKFEKDGLPWVRFRVYQLWEFMYVEKPILNINRFFLQYLMIFTVEEM